MGSWCFTEDSWKKYCKSNARITGENRLNCCHNRKKARVVACSFMSDSSCTFGKFLGLLGMAKFAHSLCPCSCRSRRCANHISQFFGQSHLLDRRRLVARPHPIHSNPMANSASCYKAPDYFMLPPVVVFAVFQFYGAGFPAPSVFPKGQKWCPMETPIIYKSE